MNQYMYLVEELRIKAKKTKKESQVWIALAGAAGSGKSTLCKFLQEELKDILLVIPLDGYHYYKKELDQMKDPLYAHKRRGAEFTFNSSKFVDNIKKAHSLKEGTFPGFDHKNADPIEHQIILHSKIKIILVEGNYLLLNKEPWKELTKKVFQETWFFDVPLDICNDRVYKRHLSTGLNKKDAKQRVINNDSINSKQIRKDSLKYANKVLSYKEN